MTTEQGHVAWIHLTQDEREAAERAKSDAARVGHPAVTEFFNDNTLVPAKLGEYVKRLGNLRVGLDGQLYRYHGGVYVPDGDTFVKVTVREVLGERCRARHFGEVLTWIAADYPSVSDRPPEPWLNVRNGLLDWRTGELGEHTPDVVTTVQFPVPWRPDAVCPQIEGFLAEVLAPEVIEFMFELIGYALYPGNPLRLAMLLLGSGRNGKSTVLRLLEALLGRRNVSAIPLQVLAENRFAAAELFGKLANISGDLDARAIRQTDIFKMAVAGDTITAERKYGSAFTFTPFATFIFAANEAPITSDQTDAWFDRWLVIPFDHRIADEQVDPQLVARLTTPDELAGLLVRAVAALRDLMGRGHFAPPATVTDAGESYRERLDTVRGFVTETCILRPDAWTGKPQLYKAYRAWCVDSGRLAVSAARFNDSVQDSYRESIGKATRQGTRGWRGISLLSDREPE